MTEIDSIKLPFQRPMDIWVLRKWLFSFHGEDVSKTLPPEDFFLEFVGFWFPVIKDFEGFNAFTEIKAVRCPVFFLVGRKDYITHSEITRRFYDQLKASKKNIFWFEDGHMIPMEHSRQMQQVILGPIAATLAGVPAK